MLTDDLRIERGQRVMALVGELQGAINHLVDLHVEQCGEHGCYLHTAIDLTKTRILAVVEEIRDEERSYGLLMGLDKAIIAAIAKNKEDGK